MQLTNYCRGLCALVLEEIRLKIWWMQLTPAKKRHVNNSGSKILHITPPLVAKQLGGSISAESQNPAHKKSKGVLQRPAWHHSVEFD